MYVYLALVKSSDALSLLDGPLSFPMMESGH